MSDTKSEWDLEGNLLRLCRAGGEAFDRMVRSLEEHTRDMAMEVTKAPASDILVAQGRAQHAQYMLMKFKDAVVLSRK